MYDYEKYIELLNALNKLIAEGKDEGPEGDKIRDLMDEPWKYLTETERENVRKVSENLYREYEMKSVFVVIGDTGEYDSRTDWVVKAFRTKEQATEFCDILNKWCKENDGDRNAVCPYDEYYRCDCLTGTRYGLQEVELV